MSTLAPASTSSDATYPPDFRTVAEQTFVRLLERDHPGVSFDLGNTWLAFYTLKNLTIPPFTQFPTEAHPTIERSLRQFQRSEPVRQALLDYGLQGFTLPPDEHVGLYRAANTLQEHEEIRALECQHILAAYKDFNSTLEPAYRRALADYWKTSERGTSRRELFIAEHKKALLLESEVSVEEGLLTSSQHTMLKDALEQTHSADGNTVQKHGVFHLTLRCAGDTTQTFPGAFVLTHAHTLTTPERDDSSLGEVMLHTEHQGLEGFESLAAMISSLDIRFNDATQQQVLLQNLSAEQRDRVLARTPGAARWSVSVMSGNVLQTQFDLQVARQQADFSQLLREARRLNTRGDEFARNFPRELTKAAHLNNAYMLDRNDHRVVASHMPHWWSATDHEHQQQWVQAAQDYAKAILQIHHLCANPPENAQASTEHRMRWLDNVKRLAIAQMQMGQIEVQTGRIPDNAKAWINAVIKNPDFNNRERVGGKAIRLEFMALNGQTLADVVRIAPDDAGANDPLVICTFNAPDSKVFRWYPNSTALREHFLENPDFSRYLLRQMPEESRPVECGSQQYEQWLKHFRAGETFKHLSRPAALPAFSFNEPAYVDQGNDYLLTHHDLKQKHSLAVRVRAATLKTHGALLGGIAMTIAMVFIPSPVLITMALGLGLFKAWSGFRHLAEGDYRGAGFEMLCAAGYLVAAGIGGAKWLAESKPFVELESLDPEPPLVCRTAPNAEQQISYLMPPEGSAHAPELDVTAPYSSDQFRAIKISDQPYFIKRQPWLFGHYQLFRVAANDPDLLIGESDYAVENSPGVWHRVVSLRTATKDWLLQQSDLELGGLTHNWPDTLEKVSDTARSTFEKTYLLLARTSNAEGMPEIEDYCEGGSLPINTLLRAGLRTPLITRFLTEFYRLHEFRGLAYRAVTVSPAGLKRLTSEIGQVFIDKGVQSASISRWNAEQWSLDEFIHQSASTMNKTVYVIFDTCVPKKNLFTGFLGDHVAVPPSTPLQLVASRLVGKRFYVFFKRPNGNSTKMFSLYSGNTELML